MATIAISELRPAGADLFDGSESYLQELTDTELNQTKGGLTSLILTTPAAYYLYKKYVE
jgi:bacteriocin-like protein